MKKIFLIYHKVLFVCIFTTFNAFGQETKTINGKVIDSLTKEPIALANIIIDNKSGASSDFDGNFKITFMSGQSNVLTITRIGYKRKTQKTSDINGHIIIELVKDTFDLDVELEITGKPLDTILYDNGQIKTINYQYQQQITFYKNGKLKSKTAQKSTRNWYQNGNLKYQSIFYTSHSESVTEWYENGQVKSHGTMQWGHNKEANAGDWFKNNNWKYWDKNGKEVTNQ